MKISRLLTLLALSLVLLACQPKNPAPQPTGASPTPGRTGNEASSAEPSPKFNLTAPDGSTVIFDPSENPDQEVFLLLFWSYRWDPNIKVFLERAEELHERYAPRGLNIIAVSYDEEPNGLRKFLSSNPLPFEVAVGSDSTAEKFAIKSIPTSILVDRSGRIAERWTGYFTTEELAEKISPYLPGRNGNS